MFDHNRRQFLRATSALLGTACACRVLAQDAPPVFAEQSGFEPECLFLTWRREPTTTMTVQWIGDEAAGSDRPLWYAKRGSMEWRQAPPWSARPFPMTEKRLFRVELEELEPDTDYQFRVGLDSAEKRFRTMPAKANDTIQFVSGGDSGVGPHAENTNRLAARQDPRFVVMGGDLAYCNGVDVNTFLKWLSAYATQAVDSQGRLIPMLACIGNHEVRGGYGATRAEAPFFYAIFDGLFTDTGYAALDFGDYMSLVLLDTNHTSPVAGEQTSWLSQTLSDREDIPTLFVLNHVPSYPSFRPFAGSDGDPDTGVGNDSREHWTPLFERYNVDAVFEHHDHTFKRTHPLTNGHIDKKGIVYLGDGSWGKIRRPKTPAERPYLAVTHEAYHLSLHRLEGKNRFHVALSDTGQVVDICRTRKRARG